MPEKEYRNRKRPAAEPVPLGFQEELKHWEKAEYEDLLFRAQRNIEGLSGQERQRLRQYGYYFLDIKHDEYRSKLVFLALSDFAGLRKIADVLWREDRDSYELPRVLRFLEDHERLRILLNALPNSPESTKFSLPDLFESLDQSLHEYLDTYLKEHQTPVATGGVNRGLDLVAIHQLTDKYDVAVPIARGGLNQGAIASLWGMKTRPLDIAAHGRKVARGKWIDQVGPEDFAGKRVLLFDKDAVSGATIQKAVKMLAPFKPASIAVYFTHRILQPGEASFGTVTHGLPTEVEVLSPHNSPLEGAGDVYLEAHEKLRTLYGQRRLVEREYIDLVLRLKEYGDVGQTVTTFVEKQLRIFDSFNPTLPGVSQVREIMLRRLQGIHRQCEAYLDSGLLSFPGTLQNLVRIFETTTPLPDNVEDTLVKARYSGQAATAARKRGVDNPHIQESPALAFQAAERAVKKGFDVALIVGPEGFDYEPYFTDLGLPTIAINIPESAPGEPRSLQIFDNLKALKGKRVLVVEDDVRTGATLQKVLEAVQAHAPSQLGLYLGQREAYQLKKNIPVEFTDVFAAGEHTTPEVAGKEFQQFLESRGLNLFKNS